VRNTRLVFYFQFLYQKWSFHQDRRGTNAGKALKRGRFLAASEATTRSRCTPLSFLDPLFPRFHAQKSSSLASRQAVQLTVRQHTHARARVRGLTRACLGNAAVHHRCARCCSGISRSPPTLIGASFGKRISLLFLGGVFPVFVPSLSW
jgi:hypothetical protein